MKKIRQYLVYSLIFTLNWISKRMRVSWKNHWPDWKNMRDGIREAIQKQSK